MTPESLREPPNGTKILLSEMDIARRRADLARTISVDYADREILLVCLLKGSMPFFVDVARELTVPVVHYGYIGAASYGDDTESSGEVEIVADLQEDIAGRHVLLIEDIVDTGRTVAHVRRHLEARQPASLKLVTLLDKPSRRQVEVEIDYVGFTIANHFVVGYGLDFAQRYRNLPFIAFLTDPPSLP